MPLNIATSLASTLIRGSNGIQSRATTDRPAELLQIYDIENCPYCRLVREALTELNLDVLILPCPKEGKRFRTELLERGGKAQFPYLYDPNTGVEMYESLDIVSYLFETYGSGDVPLKWRLGGLQTLGSMLASAPRLRRGMQARPGRPPEELLELYSFESSPYARLVREQLCEMEIPYIVRNCGRTLASEWLLPPLRSALRITPKSELDNRRLLLAREGRQSIPYLYDPNTDQGLFESGDILSYLDQHYRD
ncbi:glutathione S-transferase [Seongchinamella sediminis]|uniref:Glutathione S-transferase n=1 Tax=Seongchinamella sediminis TaxID=2283635 RepID=A0A3L7E2E7_9GAMM|nr:glutathione S-transferase N-terminal domain-containing protein [Seongchinamella sediminis]RLQ23199.1 glutathione S-transferase [Seongchinamella sediminis]